MIDYVKEYYLITLFKEIQYDSRGKYLTQYFLLLDIDSVPCYFYLFFIINKNSHV